MTTRSQDKTARTVAEILRGDHDGRFLELSEAMQNRIKAGHTDLVWQITLDGDTWDGESVTIGELRKAEEQTGKSWMLLNPKVFAGDFAALVVAHYMAAGSSEDQAIRQASALTRKQTENAVSEREVVNPPKASSDSTTS